MIMKAVYANVLMHRFADLWTWKSNKEKGNGDSFPFSLFTVCTVEIRKPIALCLDVKMIMNALYVNVPNLLARKMT